MGSSGFPPAFPVRRRPNSASKESGDFPRAASHAIEQPIQGLRGGIDDLQFSNDKRLVFVDECHGRVDPLTDDSALPTTHRRCTPCSAFPDRGQLMVEYF